MKKQNLLLLLSSSLLLGACAGNETSSVSSSAESSLPSSETIVTPESAKIFLCQVGTKKILRFYKPFIGGRPPVNGL